MQAEARKRIGARVKRLRTEAGLTLRALEMRANISGSHVSAIERGLRSPTMDLLIRLGHYLNVDPASFLSDQD